MTPLFPDRRQQSFGLRYLLFQLIFLPRLLTILFGALGWRVQGVAFQFLYFSINAAVALFFFRDFWKQTLLELPKRLPKVLLFALAGFALYRILSLGLSLLILFLQPGYANANDQVIAGMSHSHFLLTLVGTVLLVPIAEELFHRGVIFGMLYRRSVPAAYLVSAGLFSFVHIQGYIGAVSGPALLLSFLQYLPAGFCLAGAYHLSGSILAPVLIHSAVNAVVILSVR